MKVFLSDIIVDLITVIHQQMSASDHLPRENHTEVYCAL